MKKVAVMILSAVSLCSCKFRDNDDHNYLNSRNGPNIRVPAPLTNANISHLYDLPEQNKNAKVSIAPPTTLNKQSW